MVGDRERNHTYSRWVTGSTWGVSLLPGSDLISGQRQTGGGVHVILIDICVATVGGGTGTDAVITRGRVVLA